MGTIIIDDLIKPEDTNSNTLRDRWHAIYKDRLVRDTFVKQDTITKPYPVEVIKNRIPGIMWWIVLVLAVCSAPSIFKIIRKFV